MFNKDIQRSHVLENSLAKAGHVGNTKEKRGVLKGRFLTPVKGVTEKGVKYGAWHSGNRNNPHRK